ncbi:MAG: PspC domain-containing protein [Coriobacteriales bacterium]|jgi:phage shock protein PspC (stress-responsive transcriptional regulator)|nr:PspC domain-containing protein [Coriobacteriales bacterium]
MAYRKSLYRSDDAMIAGVCGGLAEYFEMDATLVRIIAVTLVLLGLGTPVLAYVIAIFVIPKKPAGQQDYVDVKPAAPTAGGAAACASAPGACYTASNSQAFDAVRPDMTASRSEARAQRRADRDVRRLTEQRGGLSKGVILGIVLVGIGLMGLLSLFVDITFWRFWPLVLVIAGVAILFSPGREGWKLERAGHGVTLITLGLVLQARMIDVIAGHTFLRLLMHLWPILLIVLGLNVIGSGMRQSSFKLLGSLVFSLALLLGAWCYGEVQAPVYLQGVGNGDLVLPIPSSPGFANEYNDAEIAMLDFLDLRPK